jgi:hypothetical protein
MRIHESFINSPQLFQVCIGLTYWCQRIVQGRQRIFQRPALNLLGASMDQSCAPIPEFFVQLERLGALESSPFTGNSPAAADFAENKNNHRNTRLENKGIMPKRDYVQQNPAAFGLQLDTFKTNIGSYPTLGLTASQIAAQAADSDYFNYVVECQSIMQNDAKAATAWRDALRNGNSAATSPAPTTLPTPVAAVMPGVEPRFRALVGQTKANVNYNTTVGTVLAIEGVDIVGPDMTTSTRLSPLSSPRAALSSAGTSAPTPISSIRSSSKSIAATAKATSTSPLIPRPTTLTPRHSRRRRPNGATAPFTG